MKARIKTRESNKFNSKLLATLFLSLLFNCLNTKAQTPKSFTINQPFSFEENKGQLKDDVGNINSSIKFYGKQGGVYWYCKPGMLSFVFTKVKNESSDISEATGQPVRVQNFDPLPGKQFGNANESFSQMDLVLVNSNPNPEISASDQQAYFENFYTTGDANHGITNVHTYKTVTYKNIYPHIDMLLNANDKGIEYSFLVHPGGKVGDIKLRWNGAKKTQLLKNGNISYTNDICNLEESAPQSFADGNPIISSFIQKVSYTSFKVGRYNKKHDLLIDPTLMWGKYFGHNYANDSIAKIKIDTAGNIYVTGNELTRNKNIFISKINTNGKAIWTTYYGGPYWNWVSGLSIDHAGKIYICGTTNSLTGIATSGAFKTDNRDSSNTAFLAKFNASGSIDWATYYAGEYDANDGYGVCNDIFNNVILLVGTSTNGLATSGVYQTSIASGYHMLISKFDSSGKQIWASYFGGDQNEYRGNIAADNSGNIVICGSTTSSSGIATSNAYQTAYGGGSEDGFLTKFNNNGNLLWSTYFGGSGYDISDALVTDPTGYIYMGGETSSNSGIATAGTYSSALTGSYEAFLSKFDTAGNLIWATYYGGFDYTLCSATALDRRGNVYLSGCTYSYTGISTSGAYQATKSGGYDAYLASFTKTGNLLWGTYIGGPFDDEGNDIAIDSQDYVYIVGRVGDNARMYSSTFSNGNLFSQAEGDQKGGILVKFSPFVYQNDAGILPTFDSLDFCKTQKISVFLRNYGSKELDSVKIGWSLNSVVQNAYNWKGSLSANGKVLVNIGSYTINPYKDTIIAWTIKPNGATDSIPENDSASITFGVKPSAGSSITACSGNNYRLGSDSVPGRTYSWSSSPTGFTSTNSNPTVNPVYSTTYYLTETVVNTGCSLSDSVSIYIPNPVIAGFSYSNFCFGDSVTFLDTSSGATSYGWFIDDTSFHGMKSLNYLFTSQGVHSVYERVSNSIGCEYLILKQVQVYPKPHANFTFFAQCREDSVHFYNIDTPANTYRWFFGDGQTSSLKNSANLYTKKGQYHVTLLDSNSPGCVDTISKTVTLTNCVWPGDANYDKVDNIYDLLAIGVAYNDTGSKRADTTTQWYAHPCADWADSFTSGANHKHADCNGDGKIDSLDMAAIIRNYSDVHSKAGSSATSGNPNDPALSLSISRDSVGTSDTISIQMTLGTASKNVSNIYGLCYTITYDPVNVGHAKSFSADLSNCWLGTLDKNLIYLVHNDPVNGKMDIGITRTDHKNISGYGSIGQLTIIMPDDVGGKKMLHNELEFDIGNVKAINHTENEISLYTTGDSVLFYGYAGIASYDIEDRNIHLFPNPAHSSLLIDAGKDFISEIKVSDILGRDVLSLKSNNSQQKELNINSLVPGTYFIYILTDHGFARLKFIKN